MAAAVAAVRRIPADAHDSGEGPPRMIVDHPTPQVVYHPERIGFFQLPDQTD